ncbi:MAG: CmpA/NrtA family ABC transporter substrate-binding protein [Cyanophyceae cyanobacterium]
MMSNRRDFLRYAGLGAASFVAACASRPPEIPQDKAAAPPPPPDFGRLEKTNLIIGFVPVVASAPLIIAQERGLFARYGLNVTLVKQASWQGIQQGLAEWRFDAALTPFSMPLQFQLGSKPAPLASLMVINLNDGAVTFSRQAWEADLRPLPQYVNFFEFADAYRKYLRGVEPHFALNATMEAYLSRYWLAAMGIDPQREVKLTAIPPAQMVYKLEAGSINGYCTGTPWDQQAVWSQAGFTAILNRDIWQGHPGNVLAAMQPWVEQQPTTARALVAAVLEACQFCDRPKNATTISQILSRRDYLDTKWQLIEPALSGSYRYSQLNDPEDTVSAADFSIFHFRDTEYLQQPNHANYPWLSHGVWLLTQMIRWHHVELTEYPPDADEILARTYPLAVYKDVAEALVIALPSERFQTVPAEAFIDRRDFDPSQPVVYLNRFKLRA